MAAVSLKKLRAQASMAFRNGDLESALATYCVLEEREPDNAIWPQRCAEIYEQQGLTEPALAQFELALGKAIEGAEVIIAIAICKHILAIDPNHVEATDRLHAMGGESIPPRARETERPRPEPTPQLNADHGPLDEVLLTETIPGASPHPSNHLENSGIIEIPLTEVVEAEESASPKARLTAREQLSNTPLFGSLDPKSLRRLIKSAELVSLDEGEVLFRQGDPADALYVVVDGAVVPIAEEDSRKKLAVLEAGSFFGEIGLMTDRPRNATIQAMVESRLLAISRKAMWALIRTHPEVLEVMLCFLRDRLVDRLIRTNPLFGAFPVRQRASVAKQFRFLEVRSGSTLIEQGRPSESLFALLAGSAQVIKMDFDSDKVLAQLESGQIFGEMSVLDESPAAAAVVAASKCWVLALPRKQLLRLTRNNPNAEAVIKQMADERESENAGYGGTPFDSDSDGNSTS